MKKNREISVREHVSMAMAIGLCMFVANAHALGATCSVNSTGLAFGAYQPITFPGKLTSADKTSTATVTVSCSGLLTAGAYSISLGPAHYGAGNGISTRYLNNTPNGGSPMAYNVYTSATYGTVWGNGTTGAVISGSAPLILGSSTNNHTVYGKIPANQTTLKAGSFSDSLTMTITYTP
jgi:spore coat protein U-like protein